MKYKIQLTIAIALLLYLVYGAFSIGKLVYEGRKTETYCGKVVDTYALQTGYRGRAERYVVFYNTTIKRNIEVMVTNQTFVNISKGQPVCFELTKQQLR
jgi:hypothetical protein